MCRKKRARLTVRSFLNFNKAIRGAVCRALGYLTSPSCRMQTAAAQRSLEHHGRHDDLAKGVHSGQTGPALPRSRQEPINERAKATILAKRDGRGLGPLSSVLMAAPGGKGSKAGAPAIQCSKPSCIATLRSRRPGVPMWLFSRTILSSSTSATGSSTAPLGSASTACRTATRPPAPPALLRRCYVSAAGITWPPCVHWASLFPPRRTRQRSPPAHASVPDVQVGVEGGPTSGSSALGDIHTIYLTKYMAAQSDQICVQTAVKSDTCIVMG